MQQLSTLQQRMAVQEKDFTHSKQKVEALCESLADVQGQLRFANEELAEKRMLISDAIKEKSRFRDMSRKLQLTIDAQNHELAVRGEQTKALILEVQRLQEIEQDRDRYRDLAAQRAGIAQSIMDAVSEDIIMAERMRDEHSHHIKKLNKEMQNKNKALQQQNNSMSRLRAELTESRRKEEEGRAREETLKREGSRRRSPSRGPH